AITILSLVMPRDSADRVDPSSNVKRARSPSPRRETSDSPYGRGVVSLGRTPAGRVTHSASDPAAAGPEAIFEDGASLDRPKTSGTEGLAAASTLAVIAGTPARPAVLCTEASPSHVERSSPVGAEPDGAFAGPAASSTCSRELAMGDSRVVEDEPDSAPT